ncbi:hypothetical protein SAMN02787142_7774 [Burkholderia sp. WP9]|uniref:hypothetical protein n=1 Tax=Burkholderia sp. WP9 TaxID=1500263 RepID=UPI0008957FD8|nr:hypothetical protein [Burkholderia sp. WP9]SEF11823.1 hypothetical protein SAMN02787142_7774 [Burkholderia sp. WP9]
MSIVTETKTLRRELQALAARPEWDLLTRHDLLSKKPPSSARDRAWRRVRGVLAALGLMSPHVTDYPWRPTLKHAPVNTDAETVLIWALGASRDDLRRACEGFSNRLKCNGGLAPVLVTEVADFAYFSRLGWLVEYVPDVSGEGHSYPERKRAYLAWRYRDARTVPLSAGLASDTEWNAVLELKRK